MRYLLLLGILMPIYGHCQTPTWQSISIDPSIAIEALVTDTLGFLWLHDQDYVYRYDGVEAKIMLGLEGEQISALDSDYNANLLIGTTQGRLISYNPYSFTQKVIAEDKDHSKITSIYRIDDKHYILLSYGKGLTIVDGEHQRSISVANGLISNEVYEAVYHRERYYVSTDQGIQVIHTKNDKWLEEVITTDAGLPDMVISNLFVYKDELWFSDYDQTIGKLSASHTATTFKLPTKAQINTITTHKDGIYIGTDRALYYFDGTSFTTKSGEPVEITQLDEEGNIWTVSPTGQLVRGNLCFQKIKLDLRDVRAIAYFQNQLIIGNEEGLYLLDDNTPVQFAQENVTCLAAYGDYLLVGTFSEGIKLYNRHLELLYELDRWHNIANQSVLSLYTHQEDIYISSLSGVMTFEMSREVLQPLQSLNAIIGESYIYTIFIDGSNIYFGTDRDGLYIWQKGTDHVDELKNFTTGEKVGSVYALSKDHTGTIWFTSTEQGLGYVSELTAEKLEHVPNIKDEYTSVKSIHDHNLLLIRGESIDILDPVTSHFMYYDREIGLEGKEPFLNTLLEHGENIVFAHDRGIYTYHPSFHTKIHPEVVLDEVRVNLSPISQEKHSFAQDENNVEFNFSGSWLTDPQKLTYQYKLEGFDDSWRTTKDDAISFPKLAPGQYRFRVRASENSRFTNEPEAQYLFTINKHFYNLWWVRVLGAVFLGFLFYKLIESNEQRKKNQLVVEKLAIENEITNLKNQLNPHFLFNSFNTLIGLIEEDQDRSVVFVEKMSDFYRNMIEFGKDDLISLEKERSILLQYISILKARFNGQLVVDMEWEDQVDHLLIPPLTLQLLVENAVKHNEVSSRKPLVISLKQKQNKIIVRNRRSPLKGQQPGTNTGLRNIEQRFTLSALPAPRIIVTDDYWEVTLSLKTRE